VTNGQLFVEFKGENFANSVSSLVAFPVEKATEGERFLEYTRERRRFYFDNAFKRILHNPAGDPLQPTAEQTRQGLVSFQRDIMKDIFYNDTPFRSETGKPLAADAFPGQEMPLIAGIVPLKAWATCGQRSANLQVRKASFPPVRSPWGYCLIG